MKSFFNFCIPRPVALARTAARTTALGLLAVVGSAGAALAQQPEPVQVTQADAQSLRVRFDNPTRHPARLMVVQLNTNEWLLNETHREPAYGTLLKFDTLPTGRYAVFLHIGRSRYHYTVQVQARPQGATLTVLNATTHRVENMQALVVR